MRIVSLFCGHNADEFPVEKARISGAGGYIEYGRVNGELL